MILPLILALSVIAGIEPSSEQSQRPRVGADLLREVQLVYGTSREGIRSISLRYTFDWGPMRREAVHARDGEKQYDAGVQVSANAWSMPREFAWDGSRVYARRVFQKLEVSSDRSIYKPGTPLPLEFVGVYVDVALGIVDASEGSPEKYEFVGGRVVEPNLIELTFEAPAVGGKLVTVHDRNLNCWPTDVTLFWHTGNAHYDVTSADYAIRERDGNALVYPTKWVVSVGANPDGSGASESSIVVDERTLRINEPLEASRFVLKPWPSETVYDIETREITPPVDPNWIEGGRVDFPFDNFAAAYTTAVAAGLTAESPEKRTAAMSLLDQAHDGRSFPWLILAAVAVGALFTGVLLARTHGRKRRRLAVGHRPGFTLIELLVVIGIVTLLLAVLLPALAAARRSARASACLAQMREVGHLMALYANDYDGTLFPTEPGLRPPPQERTRLQILVPRDLHEEMLVCPTADLEWEFLSYILNARTSYDLKKASSTGGESSPSEMIVTMDNVPGTNAEIGGDTTDFPSVKDFDRRRHDDKGSAYLWLDLHASGQRLTEEELFQFLQLVPGRSGL